MITTASRFQILTDGTQTKFNRYCCSIRINFSIYFQLIPKKLLNFGLEILETNLVEMTSLYAFSIFLFICFGLRLEDPDAEEVKEFVQKQVKLTDSVLQECETRGKLRETITKLFDHPRYYAPFRRADKYFYFHNTGLQPQNILYVQV